MRNRRWHFSGGSGRTKAGRAQWRTGRSSAAAARRLNRGLQVEPLEARTVLSGVPVISEFLAVNDRVLYDQDGDDSDWIELHNVGDSGMSLDRWYLTDDATDLQKWRVPDVTLDAGGYLVVFASGKDRNDPANELHTNFKLSSDGEYLALVMPDGQTIAHQIGPDVPPQVTDVSYGIPTGMAYSALITAGAPARVLIPTSGGLDPTEPDAVQGTWLDPALDDAQGDWFGATTGIGYVPPNEPVVPTVTLADAAADWSRDGLQGKNGWFYGYYSRLEDADRTYQARDFAAFDSSFWVTSRWDWPGSTYETQIQSSSMIPHGDATAIHWAMRRWQSTFGGDVTLQWDVAKSQAGGDGVTGRVFHNGVEVDTAQVAGDDRAGFSRTVVISNVKEGDFIDFALDPTGIGGNPLQPDDTSDRSPVKLVFTRQADLAGSITTDIRTAMQGVSSSAYLRIPFRVEDTTALDRLTLKMRYDDGFVAYVNGQQVAAANAPETARFDSVATLPRPVEAATVYESFDLSSRRDLFLQGDNVLQIHALNTAAGDDDLLILPELVVGTRVIQQDQLRYFLTPTPGASNGLGTDRVGPLVIDVTHTPNVPSATDPLLIAADVSRTFSNVASVSLRYRVMFGNEVELPMRDDGQQGDAVAGDAVYTATLPAGLAPAGQMIRWFVTARDVDGNSSRFPTFEDSSNTQQYLGTMIDDPSVQSELPVLHWFIESTSRAMSSNGARGALFYDGELYDNVFFILHGQSSSGFSTRKKSMNVDFPRDHRFRLSDDLDRMEDIDLLTNYADKSKMRNTLAYEQHALAGDGYHLAFPIRVHHNGKFFALYDFVEDPDERWLERLGLNPEGALYKMYNSLEAATGEKKTRKEENTKDLQDLVAGTKKTGEALRDYLFDNINLAAMVNFEAAFVLTSNIDCCHKNYYAYRDTGVTNEWRYMIWDVDLSQGRNWISSLNYFDDTIHVDNGFEMGANNALIGRLFALPGFREMYNRRVRTLMDEYVKPPGTPRDQMPLETRVDELYQLMKPDADLDNATNPSNWGQTGLQSFEKATQILLNEYSAGRRAWLYNQTPFDNSNVEVILSGEPGATTARYFVPADESLGRTWTQPGFDDSSWATGKTGLGFQSPTAHDYDALIQTDIKDQMAGKTSVYVRIPFDVTDPAQVQNLTLRLKIDDGFVAYLNGVEVARHGLKQDQPRFDSTATNRSNSQSVVFQNFVISQFVQLLQPGQNVLAIQGINTSGSGNDLLVLPELVDGIIVGSTNPKIPAAQVGNPKIDFGTIEFNPASRNQEEEYIALVNKNKVAVDISGWRLQGAVDYTFQPGTVIPAGWTIYATPNARAFRARSTGPKGGMELYVQGNYEGRLPNTGGAIELVGADSQLVSATTYVGETTSIQQNLRISEVMYNPLGPSAAERAADNSLVADDFEYIELVNISPSETLDLRGVKFTSGVSYDFTHSAVTQLAPGQHVLLVRNASAFQTRYGNQLAGSVAGSFTAGTALVDTGETITLEDAGGGTVLNFAYSDQADQGWPERADGQGSSLQTIDLQGDYDDPHNWRPSSEILGSPARLGDAPKTGLVINEILSRPTEWPGDQIEFWNPTRDAISTAGYFLSDSAANLDALQKYLFLGDTIAAGSYLVLSEQDFNPVGNNNDGFGLSGTRGDQVFLTFGDNGRPTHFVDSVSFGAAAAGESFGRTPNGSGRWAPMKANTFGAANSDPRVGPIVISELNYAPGSPTAADLAIDPDLTANDLEFVEIHNPTSTSVNLSGWRLRGGVDFDFAAGAVLDTGQTLVVISFNPSSPDNVARTAAFRAHYGIGASTRLVGGYSGQLYDQGEAVRLQRPGDPSPDDPTSIPRLLEDEVFYDDVAPWPVAAAGGGKSLSRVTAAAYGNASASWIAATPSPGQFGGVPGDLTDDGMVDVQDIDRLSAAIRAADPKFDLTGDQSTDLNDLLYLLRDILGTSIGDADLDGRFSSDDFIRVFQAGEFGDPALGNSTWADGDWNCDGDFNEDDLMFALQWGDYELEAAAVPAVPRAAVAAALAHEIRPTAAGRDTDRDVQMPAPTSPTRAAIDLELASRESFFADYEPNGKLASSTADDAVDLLLGTRE